MALSLTAEDFAGIGYLHYGALHTLFVDPAADGDAGSGFTPAAAVAKKTVAGAVAAAVAGDLIVLAPGTYKESIDASAAAMHFRGCGPNTIITNGSWAGEVTSGTTSRVLTIDAGHGITSATTVAVYWTDVTLKKRSGMTVTANDATTITVTAASGTGDTFPANSTAITVCPESQATTLTLASNSSVENMSVVSTKLELSAANSAAILSTGTNLRLRRVKVMSNDIGLSIINGSNGDYSVVHFIDDSVIWGAEYGIDASGSNLVINNSILKAMDWSTCSSMAIRFDGSNLNDSNVDANLMIGFTLNINNCNLFARRLDSANPATYHSAVIKLAGGMAKINGCSLQGFSKADTYMRGIEVTDFPCVIDCGETNLYLSTDGAAVLTDFYNDTATTLTRPMFTYRGHLNPGALYRNGYVTQYNPTDASKLIGT